MDRPLRLVLDTNVVIDWLVFDDSYLATFRERVVARDILVLTNSLAVQELARVLAYPMLKLDPERRSETMARYAAQTTPVAMPDRFDVDELLLPARFPHCRDRDDDAFLALAFHANATALVTRDKALLKLCKRARRFGVAILDVPQMVALLGA